MLILDITICILGYQGKGIRQMRGACAHGKKYFIAGPEEMIRTAGVSKWSEYASKCIQANARALQRLHTINVIDQKYMND